MQTNRASLVKRQPAATVVVQFRARKADRATVERAAQALFAFVFSACDRLDGKHDWNECDEETKEGFRAEAAVVIDALWPASREAARATRAPSLPSQRMKRSQILLIA